MSRSFKNKIAAMLLCSATFFSSTCFTPNASAAVDIPVIGTIYGASDVAEIKKEFESKIKKCRKKIDEGKKIDSKDEQLVKFEDKIDDLELSVNSEANKSFFSNGKYHCYEDGIRTVEKLDKKIDRYVKELQEKTQLKDPKEIEARQNQMFSEYKESLIKSVDGRVEQLESYLKDLGEEAQIFEGEVSAVKNRALGIKNNICNAILTSKLRSNDTNEFSSNIESVFSNTKEEIEHFETQVLELVNAIIQTRKDIQQKYIDDAKEEFKNWLEEKRKSISEQFAMCDLDGNNDAKDKVDSLKEELFKEMELLKEKIDQIVSIEQVGRFQTTKRLFEKKCERNIALKNRIVDEHKKKIEDERRLVDMHDFDKQCDMLREGKVSIDEVIGGYDNIKTDVHNLLEQHRRAVRMGNKIKPSKGMILYGRPGTGKTTMVKAMAASEKCDIVVLKKHTENGNDNMVAEIKSKFKYAKDLAVTRRNEVDGNGNKVDKDAIVVLLIDEIDALAGHRQDVPSGDSATTKETVTLLSELDELKPSDGVVILATTNLPLAVDPAVRRSERLEQSVEVAIPSESDLRKILTVNLKGYRFEEGQTAESMSSSLAGKFRGKTGADITRAVELAVQQRMTDSGVSLLSDIVLYKRDIEKIIKCC